MIKNYIIEGIDRTGKSSLIKGIKNSLGFFQVVHYQKPEILDCYSKDGTWPLDKSEKEAVMTYQHRSFCTMFDMLNLGGFIMDRSHLGEAVYSKRYRGYRGDYVFDLEKEHDAANNDFALNTVLVLLTTSDFSFIADDGLSLDFSKKEEEQEDFKKAFNKSIIKSKIMIDVSHQGFYKPAKDILEMVIKM